MKRTWIVEIKDICKFLPQRIKVCFFNVEIDKNKSRYGKEFHSLTIHLK